MNDAQGISRFSTPVHSGMTLLETLAALALLSIFTFGGGAWIVSASHAARAVTTSSQDSISLTRALDALRADLIEATPESIDFDMNQNEVRVITMRGAPGEGIGWRRVTWRLNESSLVRVEQSLPEREGSKAPCAILHGVESFVVMIDEVHEVNSTTEIFVITLRLTSGSQTTRVWAADP